MLRSIRRITRIWLYVLPDTAHCLQLCHVPFRTISSDVQNRDFDYKLRCAAGKERICDVLAQKQMNSLSDIGMVPSTEMKHSVIEAAHLKRGKL